MHERNDQISENDLNILSQKAKDMIESGNIPPAPESRVREGKPKDPLFVKLVELAKTNPNLIR